MTINSLEIKYCYIGKKHLNQIEIHVAILTVNPLWFCNYPMEPNVHFHKNRKKNIKNCKEV
jgi:hypothetical protein